MAYWAKEADGRWMLIGSPPGDAARQVCVLATIECRDGAYHGTITHKGMLKSDLVSVSTEHLHPYPSLHEAQYRIEKRLDMNAAGRASRRTMAVTGARARDRARS